MTDELQALLARAFSDGATAVHDAWIAGNGQSEADFGEAASDYAASVMDTERPALIAEVERLRGLLAEITPSRLIGESHVPYPTGKTTVIMSWGWLKRARAALGVSHDAK